MDKPGIIKKSGGGCALPGLQMQGFVGPVSKAPPGEVWCGAN
ncbi:hypothetical protein LJPFL01_1945 [Lelliottia jeotgali]|nr:hypothetical protein LJPFL01_1945 [Lelliottia jeotgali]